MRRIPPILLAALVLVAPSFLEANRPRTRPRASRPATYEIRPGDTLSEIAERFSIPPEDLVRANRLGGDGAVIYAGEEIVIPGDEDDDAEPIRFRLPADPSRMRVGSGEMALWLIVRPPTRALLRSAGQGPRVPAKLRWPVASHRIGRGYGSGRSCRHFALDIPAPLEERVRAAAGGYVAYSGPFRGYGNTVILVHPGGAVTLYGHLTSATARPRTKVRRGQVIGLSGSTGVSRGPHLHFSLFVGGKPIDAAPYMSPEPTYDGGRYGCVVGAELDVIAADGSPGGR